MADDTATASPPQSDKGFSALLASAGVMSPAELEKKSQAIVTEHKAARQPYIDQSNALMKQYEVLNESMAKIERPKEPKLEKMPEVPESQYKDPMQALGSLASVLAIFGSLRTRAPMTAALNSAAAAMKGFHQGDQERVKLEQEKWQDQMTKGLRQNQEEMQKYTAALQSSQFDLEKAQPAFRSIAAANEHNAFLAAIEDGDYKTQNQILTSMMKAGTEGAKLLTTHMDRQEAIKAREAATKASAQAHADSTAATAQYRSESLQLRRDQMEEKSSKAAEKVVAAGKPAERAVEIIGEMKGILEQKIGVTGMAGMVRRPLETIVSTLGGSDAAPAHQYESLARELQNILRKTEEFNYKGRTLSKEVADRDVMVRGLKFGDTDGISMDQLNHLENLLTKQGTGFTPGGADTPKQETKVLNGKTYIGSQGNWTLQ